MPLANKVSQAAPAHRSAASPELDARIPRHWRAWVAENLALDIGVDRLVAALLRDQIPEEVARAEIQAANEHPYVQATRRLASRLKKLESLLEVQHTLGALRFGAGAIERRSAVSTAEFRERYYAANRPVILTGTLKGNSAFLHWTPAHLRSLCGDATVEVMSDRDADANYEANSTQHKTSVRFADYIDRVLSGGASNDYYLVANNKFFEQPDTRILCKDVPKLSRYLERTPNSGRMFFWFGPAGTVTPLHHDVMNVLLAQLRGRKRFTLIPPDQTHHVYNQVGVYSAVDVERPDHERFPAFRRATPIRFVLEPGEVLFIPVGWWHHVRALDLSMSISYTNFKFPNEYTWAHPHLP
jgi:hypothetical protein